MSKEHKKDRSCKTSHEAKRQKDDTVSSSSAAAASGNDHRTHHKDHKDRSKDSHNHHAHQHKKHKSGIQRQPSALKMDMKLEPLNHSDILGDLNSPLTGYDDGLVRPSSSQPLLRPKVETIYDPNLGVTSRKARTMVYAGHSRAVHYDHVPRLEDLCLNLLADNLDKITCLGDAPFYLVKPVLAKCTPSQLRRIEKYNEDLIDETDSLWKLHAEQEFKGMEKHRKETYRQFFHRATIDRDCRLQNLTKKIQKKSVKDQAPVKKTMVVETIPSKGRKLPASTKSATQATTITAAEIKKNAKDVRVGAAAKAKHRTGPLMAKTLQMFKQRFRR